jgi:CheY-like chemotaxis protein
MPEPDRVPRVALIVEDDEEQRSLAAALLEETDLAVVEACDAEEALAYLSGHAGEVALLFADAQLPRRVTGVDLAKTVSHQWPWVRTVLTSGAPLDGDDNRVPHEVRLMPKPWRALDVLIEAERASRSAAGPRPLSGR